MFGIVAHEASGATEGGVLHPPHRRSRSVGDAGGGEDPGTADTLHSGEGVPEKRNVIPVSVPVLIVPQPVKP